MKRYTFVGQVPITGDHRAGTPTGDLLVGDTVTARPTLPGHPGFTWTLTNERNGFTMDCPPHDLKAL